MARSVTLQTIADRARFYADQRSASFVNDTEMLSLINDAVGDLYDEMVAAYGENYFASTSTVTLTAGTSSYALPADFYKLIGVDFQIGTGQYVTLVPYPENERNRALTSTSSIPSGTVRLRYVPAPTTYTALSQSIDGVSGWDRLISLAVAIDIMEAEESNTSGLRARYGRVLQRIQEMAPTRDQSMPGRVSDIYRLDETFVYGQLRYRMYGSNIEFINNETLGVGVFA